MDLLSEVLSLMNLSGTLYFRTSFTSSWGVRVPAFQDVSRFHFAHRGRCLVRIDPEKESIHLEQGDLVIITRGAAHTLYFDAEAEDQALPLDQVVEKSGFTGNGTLVYGTQTTSQETQLVCGHFALDKNANHPLIDALPPYIHIQNYGESAGSWMENTLKVIGIEAGKGAPGSDIVALKMSEIIFALAIRTYLSIDGTKNPVLAGFTEPRISHALQAFHNAPAYSWTLESLARTAGLSRTAFVLTFNKCMSMTPMAYMTQWRMQIARKMLLETNKPMIEIAESVSYKSEAALTRVFKRHFKLPPATYRRQHQINPE